MSTDDDLDFESWRKTKNMQKAHGAYEGETQKKLPFGSTGRPSGDEPKKNKLVNFPVSMIWDVKEFVYASPTYKSDSELIREAVARFLKTEKAKIKRG